MPEGKEPEEPHSEQKQSDKHDIKGTHPCSAHAFLCCLVSHCAALRNLQASSVCARIQRMSCLWVLKRHCSACCEAPIALVSNRPCPALDCASTCAGHTEANKQVKVSEDHDSSSGTKDNRTPEEKKELQETHDGHVSSSSAHMCSPIVLLHGFASVLCTQTRKACLPLLSQTCTWCGRAMASSGGCAGGR